ncbi:MAG: ricin-type beta-trefoil lectin domain protein [Actinomycetota bacterium]
MGKSVGTLRMLESGAGRRALRAVRNASVVAGVATLGLAAVPGGLPGASAQSGAAAAASAPSASPAAAGPPSSAAQAPATGVPASARFVSPPPVVPRSSGLRQACATPTRPGQMACDALIPAAARPDGASNQPPSNAYGPADLQDAYALTAASATQGHGQTIAIVAAFNDPHAASDLAVYRSHYHLPPCTTAKKCLRVVNQAGGTRLPDPDPTGGWELEEALDLDVVSAICPNCRILLIEASSDSIASLARAEKYAVTHARIVSNSWGSGAEFTGEGAFDPDFSHPGVAVVAAAGDGAYGTQYPAAAQFVTSAGGTTLRRAANTRGWAEQVWRGTGSGCSSIEVAPAWQQGAVPAGCQNRTETDVSADADPYSPVAVYDSVKVNGTILHWIAPGGTSVSTPIIASAYALAATAGSGPYPRPRTFPASYPYAHRGDFFSVTDGGNGTCEKSRGYLCHGRAGYDGPTGLGTPDGIAGFAPASPTAVTVRDPGTLDVERGAGLNFPVKGYDAAGGGLAFRSGPLPAGLHLSAAGVISGIPRRAGSTTVRVTAQDKTTGTAGSVSFRIVVLAKLADPHPGTGLLQLTSLNRCLGAAAGQAVITACHSGTASAQWQYIPAGDPGGAGQLKSGGRCLGSTGGNGSRAVLGACTGGPSQWWALRSGGRIVSPQSGRCLDDPGNSISSGTPVDVRGCNNNSGQFWTLPPAPVISGVTGMCLTDPGNRDTPGTRITISHCSRARAQQWTLRPGISGLEIRGMCLTVAGGSKLDGAAIELRKCTKAADHSWLKGPHGQVLNARSGRCLAVPSGASASGTKLVQDDCTGRSGEIWAIS